MQGYLIIFVSVVINLLKYLWWPIRVARSFKGQSSDPYAAVVPLSESKADVGLYIWYARILSLWSTSFNYHSNLKLILSGNFTFSDAILRNIFTNSVLLPMQENWLWV